MKEFSPKVGMWRCRDGSIACVWHITPAWLDTKWQLLGYRPNEGITSWDRNGRASDYREYEYDLIEHLSDEIADPRTWKPPVTLCEGVWEFDDGSRGVCCKP